MSRSGTVAVLLPGAFYFLNETRRPPVELLREYQVPMAVATDYNPGTSPFASLHLAMNMACVKFGLTPEEAWAGVTRHAAQALGRQASHGCWRGLLPILLSGTRSIRLRWFMSRGAVRSGSAWCEEKSYDTATCFGRDDNGKRQRAAPVFDYRDVPQAKCGPAGVANRPLVAVAIGIFWTLPPIAGSQAMFSPQPRSAPALYEKVKQAMQRDPRGVWRPHDRIPSEAELVAQFGFAV
jgi:hypothetical protein